MRQSQFEQRTGCRIGRLRRTSSFAGLAPSFFHVSSHSGRSHLMPPNKRTGERTGQNSWNITSLAISGERPSEMKEP